MQTDEMKKVMVVYTEYKPGTLFLQIRETNTHDEEGAGEKTSVASAYQSIIQ